MAAATNYVPLAGRVFWFYEDAGGGSTPIPANWTRDTDFDDRFLQGHATTAGTNAGGGHTHTQSHTHTGNSHTHSFSGNSITTGVINKRMDFGGISVPAPTHGHNSATSNAGTITYQNDSTSTASGDAIPPHTTAIIIKPDDASQDIPDDGICFSDQATAPASWAITDGNNGTIDLDGDFILGADTGTDGGGIGGSATHTHTSTSTHDINDHNHGSSLCGTFSGIRRKVKTAITSQVYLSRHHNVFLQTKALADLSTDAVVIDNATFEPVYTEMLGIQNITGSADTPLNVIIPFTGAVGDIPSNWALCDGSGGTEDLTANQIKVTATGGDVGNTGGNNNHTHTSTTAHGHTHSGSHNHLGPSYDEDIKSDSTEAGTPSVEVVSTTKSHSHVWTAGTATPTLQNATFTTGSSDGRYNYRTVLFIKKTSLAVTEQSIVFFGCNT